MKAKDLRIGNYVADDDKTLVRIHDGTGIDHAKQFEPIPLTEEWLEKFGFEKRNYNFKSKFFGNLEWIELDADNGHFNVFYKQENNDTVPVANDCILMSIELKHVHQLQNLYHALTGEELCKD